jgi:DNA-binding CsgD family transcriptional regulator
VLVLDPEARMVVMNGAAETLLARADGLCLTPEGRLRTVDEARTAALELAIRNCAGPVVSAPASAADRNGIALPRLSGASPVRLMISPLPFLGGPAISPGEAGRVLLVIFDPDEVRRTPVEWMARQFGLTPSEQRLTEAIVNGVPLAEAAEQLGIQLSTARTRLKTIQTKTHCHRQVDLVRLALSPPAVRP